ncbi:MAG: head-tail connector protein [Firmicutes bacterium]|nr:head-tail connector protein [Bacillota bacterium]
MEEIKTEILEASRLLLNIDDEDSDELLSLLIDAAADAVMAYCRIEVLPRPLVSLIPALVARQFEARERGGVKSVTEGERRVEYQDGEYDFLSEYAARLKPFMSRKVKVPSDLESEKNDESV